jgi:hypothetical protein
MLATYGQHLPFFQDVITMKTPRNENVMDSVPDGPNPVMRTIESNVEYETFDADIGANLFYDLGRMCRFARSVTIRNPYGIVDQHDDYIIGFTHDKEIDVLDDAYPIFAGEALVLQGPFSGNPKMWLFVGTVPKTARIIVGRTCTDIAQRG